MLLTFMHYIHSRMKPSTIGFTHGAGAVQRFGPTKAISMIPWMVERYVKWKDWNLLETWQAQLTVIIVDLTL
jgi:hypothetical protein